MLTKYLLTPKGDGETLNSLLMYKLENANFNYEINVTRGKRVIYLII